MGGTADAAGVFVAGMTLLPSGDLLVADPLFRRIRRISAGADGVVDGSADEGGLNGRRFSDNTYPTIFNGTATRSRPASRAGQLAADPRGFVVATSSSPRPSRGAVDGHSGSAAAE